MLKPSIVGSCVREVVNAECLPLISSVPLRSSVSQLQSLHFCLGHCRGETKKKQNKTKKGRPKANMRREIRTDSLTRKSTSPSGTSGRPTFVNVEFLPKYVWPCTAPGLENWSTPNKQPTKKLDRRIRVPQRFLTSSGSVDWRGREIAIVSNNNSAVAVYLDSV